MKLRLLLLVLAPLLAACETLGYYLQAASGQLELNNAARPLADWLADPQTPASLRTRLETARSIREFASHELALPDNASYRSYADLKRPYLLWNLFAAPEFSIEPRIECFPFAGCVAYRGFFAEADARARAARLGREGFDVFVAGVPAYSTLGWFDDPLVSTFIHYPEAELARLVFHELAHQVLYVKDDSSFNESFAVAVEEEGVRRWMERGGKTAELAQARQVRLRRQEFGDLVEQTRTRLAPIYEEKLAPDALRAKKRAEFARMRAEFEKLKAGWGGYTGYDRFFAVEPNNALLVAFSTYARKVPAFERLLAAQRGDLPAFYRAVKELAALPREERDARLDALR